MYGAAVFTEEVLRNIENELMQYLQKENISYLGQPLPEDNNDPAQILYTDPKDYTFSFEIGLKPEFAIPDMAKAKTTLNLVEATDKMVKEEVERFQQRLGKMTEPETVTNEEDILNVSFQKSDAAGVAEEVCREERKLPTPKIFFCCHPKTIDGKEKRRADCFANWKGI